MKYEDLITNFTKLLYATQEETIKNITTKGIQETPDSISRGTEKKRTADTREKTGIQSCNIVCCKGRQTCCAGNYSGGYSHCFHNVPLQQGNTQRD